jgi:hypothetical protein
MEQTKIIQFIGEYLRVEEFCTVDKIQGFISKEIHQGGILLPTNEVKTMLDVLVLAGFLTEHNGQYSYAKKEYVVVEKIIQVCNFDKSQPVYLGELGSE